MQNFIAIVLHTSLAFLVVSGLVGCDGQQSNSLSGPYPDIRVIDGDTLERDGVTLDMAGIDAPELGQRCLSGEQLYDCGHEAAFSLHKRVVLERAECTSADQGPGQVVCKTPAGSLALQLIEAGIAVADGGEGYAGAGKESRQVLLGIWRGDFTMPSAWRSGSRLSQELADPQPCPILGIENAGERFYIVPTDDNYASWESKPAAILQRFCSDEEARARGWDRPSRRQVKK